MRKEKIRQTDFTERELPKTRRAQFGDLFRHRFVDLLKLSLLQAVFLIPLFVSVILFYVFARAVENYDQLFTNVLFTGISLVITVPAANIGYAGLFYALKELAYREGGFSSSSFFRGLKENWKGGLYIGLIEAVSSFAALVGGVYLYGFILQANAWIVSLGIALLAVQFVFVSAFSKIALGQFVVYSNSFAAVLKNSFLFTMMNFPINLLLFFVSPGIFVVLIAVMEITSYVGIAWLLLLSAFFALGHFLNDLYMFDKFINKEHYPAEYRRGLSKDKGE